jgi:hypothetical protein
MARVLTLKSVIDAPGDTHLTYEVASNAYY